MLIRPLAAALTLPPLLVFGALWFLLDDAPLVPPTPRTTGTAGEPGREPLAAFVEALSRRSGLPAAGRIIERRPASQRQLQITLTTPLPRPYLNVSLLVDRRQPRPRILEARIGDLALPASWVAAILPLERSEPHPASGKTASQRPAAGALLGLLAADAGALQRYYDRLWRWDRHRQGRRTPLLEPLRILFAHARRHTTERNAAGENRALLQVLAAYVNRRDPAPLFGLASRGNLHHSPLTLQGRNDLARHFLTTAAISASGGAGLARYLGLYKEVRDFDTGSGFSFSDLAADMAGTRFGRLAITHPRHLQRYVVLRLRDEYGLLPNVKAFPDHLGRADFRRRFGRIGSPAYRHRVSIIERRIDALPLYRHLGRNSRNTGRHRN